MGAQPLRHRSAFDDLVSPRWSLDDQLPLLAYAVSPGDALDVTYLGPPLAARLGRSLDDINDLDTFWELVHPDDRDVALAGHAAAIDADRPSVTEYRLLATDGVVWVHDEAQLIPAADGTGPSLRGFCIDITGRKRVEAELRTSEEQFRSVVANIPGVVYRCACDAAWTMQFMSEHILDLSGYPADDFIGNRVRSYGSIIHPDDRPRVVTAIDEALAEGAPYSLEYRVVHADGDARWIAEQGTAILDRHGHRLWLDGVIFDITQRKLAEQARDLAEEQLKHQAEVNRHQALHDSLTGLPNRTLFHDRVSQALHACRRESGEFAVLIMDLDRFKEINDSLGHASGDRLLQEISTRLLDTVRECDSIARLGGDEFGLLLPGASPTSVVDVIERIRAAVEQPCALEGVALSVEASVGVAFFPVDGTEVDLLMLHADIAMYAAKQTHAGYAIYSPAANRREPKRLMLVSELRRAIDDGELLLHFQPKVALCDGRVTGVEALVRWLHPERGLIMPDEFIPTAQVTGLINRLTHYVIDAALRQCRTWHLAGHTLPIAVNISSRSLIDVAFPDDVARLMRTYDVGPGLLELELTEDAMIADPIRTRAVLDRLSAMGIRLAVDDFGTGYSSLAHLRRLPIDDIKIDRSFVTNLTTSKEDEVIVHSTIDLARNLGLQVVAEGVENEQVWACLKRLGCHVAQGHHMSRPIPADELTAWLGQLPEVDGAAHWRALGPR